MRIREEFKRIEDKRHPNYVELGLSHVFRRIKIKKTNE